MMRLDITEKEKVEFRTILRSTKFPRDKNVTGESKTLNGHAPMAESLIKRLDALGDGWFFIYNINHFSPIIRDYIDRCTAGTVLDTVLTRFLHKMYKSLKEVRVELGSCYSLEFLNETLKFVNFGPLFLCSSINVGEELNRVRDELKNLITRLEIPVVPGSASSCHNRVRANQRERANKEELTSGCWGKIKNRSSVIYMAVGLCAALVACGVMLCGLFIQKGLIKIGNQPSAKLGPVLLSSAMLWVGFCALAISFGVKSHLEQAKVEEAGASQGNSFQKS